ncbi:MAG: hypothetical protein HRF49_04040 [bacterium]|jgi:hypothetical protein
MNRRFLFLVVGIAAAIAFCGQFARAAHAENVNVAITEFAGSDQEAGRMVSQIIQGALASVPGVTVVDRQHLGDVLKEQRLNISGFVDMNSLSGSELGSLCQVGQLVGATHIVTGSFSRDSNVFVLTINLVSVTTGSIEDTATATAPSDEYFAGILSASNRFAGRIAGKSLSPDALFGKLELVMNVEWTGGELLSDPRADLKSRIEQATGLPVASRDISGQQMAGSISQVFKDDLAIESGIKSYSSGMNNPLLLVNFQPIKGPESGGWIAYKARMYWAAYFPMLGGAVVHGVTETGDFGKGYSDAQAISQAVAKTYDLFVSKDLYKIVGDFGSAGTRVVTVKISGTSKQDHLSIKGALSKALGISAFKADYFSANVSTFAFEYSGSMQDVKNALLGTQKLEFISMDNQSINMRRVV